MKNPKTPAEKPASKTKPVQPATAVVSEVKAKKSSAPPKASKKTEAPTPKPANKAESTKPVAIATTEAKPKKPSPPQKSTEMAKAVPVTLEIPLSERVGLTAGSIWHFLDKNGASSVAKLIREIQEEEKIIQRSIGWLAQEGKITLNTIDKVETIGLQ